LSYNYVDLAGIFFKIINICVALRLDLVGQLNHMDTVVNIPSNALVYIELQSLNSHDPGNVLF